MDARYAGYSLCIRTTSLLKCAHIQWLGRFVLFSAGSFFYFFFLFCYNCIAADCIRPLLFRAQLLLLHKSFIVAVFSRSICGLLVLANLFEIMK